MRGKNTEKEEKRGEGKAGGERKRNVHGEERRQEGGTEHERGKKALVLLNHYKTQCPPQAQEKWFAKFKWQYSLFVFQRGGFGHRPGADP